MTPEAVDRRASPSTLFARSNRPHWRFRNGALELLGGIVLVLAQIARNPRVLDRIWAEDGAVFGRQAFNGHIWQQIGRGYAGYLVAPERLLAAPIVSVVPPRQWGMWFALSSMAIAAFAGVAVFRLSAGIVSSTALRFALGVLVAVGPKMRGEWPAISNVGWPLLVAFFWIIISVRTDTASTILRCVVAVGAITSSGLGLAFLPLAVAVLALREQPIVTRFLDRPSLLDSDEDRRRLAHADRALLATIAIAAVLQVVGLATAVAGPKAFRSTVPDILRLLMVRVFGSTLVGERFIDEAWRSWGMAFAVGSVLIVVAALALLTRRCDRTTRTVSAVAVVYAVMIGAASLKTRGTEPFALQPGRFSFDAERYFIVPAFLVVSALAIALDRRIRPAVHTGTGTGALSRSRSLRSFRVADAFAGFILVVLVATGFNQRNAEQPSDPWSVVLRRATVACRADPALARVDIPIAPAGIFRLNVPCSRLR